MMRIATGDYEVLKDGTVIGIDETPIQFLIEDLIFEFVFINEPESQTHSIKAEEFNDKKGIKIIFTNFNNSLGIGNKIPLPLATINNKQLFLNYRIYSLSNDAAKTVHYTWYTKELKEVKNG